jgi:hypothetical protein
MEERTMKLANRILALLAVVSITIAGACSNLTAPDFNNPGVDQLEGAPTRAAVAAAATGLLIGARDGISEFNGYVSHTGVVGREAYNLRGDDARFVTQLLTNTLDPGARALGGAMWNERYANIRSSNIVLNALDALTDVPPDGMTPAEKEAARGFAKTMQAHDLLLAINSRDTNGAPIDVDQSLDAPPAPIASKDQVFQRVVDLLEQARGHLQAGGDAFPFPLSPGFDGFDTPASFLQFNRALLARVEVYRMNFAAALTALDGSFVSTAAPLDLGVFHTFLTGSGDQTNGLVDANLFVHPAVETDAELQPDGQLDRRFLEKTNEVAVKRLQDLESDIQFQPLWPSPSTSVPIIRNEELILLRAEANIGLGNIGPAADDINFIRVNSGGLAARDDIDAGNALDELLDQKRYSLLFEGGHRWIDMRRYGRLDELPLDRPGDAIVEAWPLPIAETLPR